MIADLNEDAGKKVIQDYPGSLQFHRTDVSKDDNWKSLVEATKASFGGRIDCLVNNAGTTHANQVRVLLISTCWSSPSLTRFIAVTLGNGGRFRQMLQCQCERRLLRCQARTASIA